jgi:ribosomal protein L36
MKVLSSVKGRGKKMNRRGRMAQGYFVRRGGTLYFYNFDESSLGARIKMRQPIPRKKKKVRKY